MILQMLLKIRNRRLIKKTPLKQRTLKHLSLRTDLFYHFKKSSARINSLKAIQTVLELPQVKVKEVHEIRWLAFYSALSAVYRAYPALLRYFHDLKQQAEQRSKKSKAKKTKKKSEEQPSERSAGNTQESSNTNSDKDSSTTKFHYATSLEDLGDAVSSYRFIAIIHFLMDVIPPVAQLNLLFQQQAIDISAIAPAVENVLKTLSGASKTKGLYEKEFENKIEGKIEGNAKGCSYGKEALRFREHYPEQVKEARLQFIDELSRRIKDRFPIESRDLVTAFDVLGMRQMTFLQGQDAKEYGDEKLQTLLSHYGSEKKTNAGAVKEPLVNDAEAKSEWELLKTVVIQQKYPRNSTATLWKYIHEFHSQSFPNLLKLAEIGLILPLHTSDVERGFSVQNLIHTGLRNRLGVEMVDKHMTINLVGPPIEEFDFQKAVALWKTTKQRTIFQ